MHMFGRIIMRKRIKTLRFVTAMILFTGIMTACGAPAAESPLPATENKEADAEKSEETSETSEKTIDAAEDTTGEDISGAAKVSYPDESYADDIDDKLAASSADNYVRSRATDSESGDIVDTSIFKTNNDVVKIITEDHGSEGRIVSEYYYYGDTVAFMKQYKTDIFGIFSSYTEADFSDTKADYTGEVLSWGDEALKEAKKDKGQTLLYGYVGDEQGGVLKNVTVKIRNVDGSYNDETSTDGDGYYTLYAPQKDDIYSLTYEYGDWAVSSLNDVHICPGIPEYSLGRVYVAPEGNAIHDTDVYLLNANAKPPVSLKNDEYAVVLSSDDPSMTVRLVNLDDQSDETGAQITFDHSKSSRGFALFVEDNSNLGKDDMAGTIGRTYMTITIFDRNGIKAAYREPSGRLGTLWKVCEITDAGDTEISGIMFTDSKGWPWLK